MGTGYGKLLCRGRIDCLVAQWWYANIRVRIKAYRGDMYSNKRKVDIPTISVEGGGKRFGPCSLTFRLDLMGNPRWLSPVLSLLFYNPNGWQDSQLRLIQPWPDLYCATHCRTRRDIVSYRFLPTRWWQRWVVLLLFPTLPRILINLFQVQINPCHWPR